MPTEDEAFAVDPLAFVQDRLSELKVIAYAEDATLTMETPERKLLVVPTSVQRHFNMRVVPPSPKWKIKGSTVAKAMRKRNAKAKR